MKLQSLHCDLEESLGTLDLARTAYDRVIELKVARGARARLHLGFV